MVLDNWQPQSLGEGYRPWTGKTWRLFASSFLQETLCIVYALATHYIHPKCDNCGTIS